MVHEEYSFQAIRRACGYVENGSNQRVSIFQDDATGYWFIEAGNKVFSGVNLQVCLAQAYEYFND